VLDEGEIVFFESCEQVSKRLTVSRQANLPDSRHLVYSEASFGGYTIVQQNTSGTESNINLEVLFNAVVTSKEKIYDIFKR